jgi:hypothetical protein
VLLKVSSCSIKSCAGFADPVEVGTAETKGQLSDDGHSQPRLGTSVRNRIGAEVLVLKKPRNILCLSHSHAIIIIYYLLFIVLQIEPSRGSEKKKIRGMAWKARIITENPKIE